MQKPPKLKTAITEMLGIDYPIFAAPMFLISDAKLTVAACKAGATGAFPALNFRPVEEVRKVIREIKSQTKAPFGVNIVMYALTGNYKSDQVHVPAILERLGQ